VRANPLPPWPPNSQFLSWLNRLQRYSSLRSKPRTCLCRITWNFPGRN